MECTFSKSDIRKFWSQIVEERGVDYCTPEEWQEHYTDFCRCMLSESEPFTRIDTVKNWLLTINYNTLRNYYTESL